MKQRSRAFAPTLGLGPPKGASIDRLSGDGASAGVCLLSSALGVARCDRSAGCVLCALWSVSAAVCVLGGGGLPCGGKHIIIITHTIEIQLHDYCDIHTPRDPLYAIHQTISVKATISCRRIQNRTEAGSRVDPG